ncbi:MAG: hypothetical protein M3R69_17995 [Acidobacteriota bacterium]|nr:hypothetical protein [Acidobacteriota bacterium]
MIPYRMLSSEFFANGLRGRVSACRKRLRINRPAYRTHASHRVENELEQLFPETNLAVTYILGDCREGRRTLIRLECSDGFADNEASSSKMLLSVEEQEVGIT